MSKDMICNKFQYEIGKVYTIPTAPQLCSKGFHFCLRLSDVFIHYDNSNSNRFFEVEVIHQALLQYSSSKISTNGIKIVRELGQEEMKEILYKEKVEECYEMVHKLFTKFRSDGINTNDLMIGGSIGLILQGGKLPSNRHIKDVDIISISQFDKQQIKEKYFKELKNNGTLTLDDLMHKHTEPSGDEEGSHVEFQFNTDDGTLVEIFKECSDYAHIKRVKHTHKGLDFYLVPIEEIIKWKFLYGIKGIKSNYKHMDDMIAICEGFKK